LGWKGLELLNHNAKGTRRLLSIEEFYYSLAVLRRREFGSKVEIENVLYIVG